MFSPRSSPPWKAVPEEVDQVPQDEDEIQLAFIGEPVGIGDEPPQVLVEIVESDLRRVLAGGERDILFQVFLVEVVAEGDVEIGQVDETEPVILRPQGQGVKDLPFFLPALFQDEVIKRCPGLPLGPPDHLRKDRLGRPGPVAKEPGLSPQDAGMERGADQETSLFHAFQNGRKNAIGKLFALFHLQGEFLPFAGKGGTGHQRVLTRG